MCLYAAALPKYAKRSVTVYKVLTKGNRSPYRDFLYEKGKTLPQKKLSISQYGSVGAGYHAYRTKKRAIHCTRFSSYPCKVVKMRIPAGHYYIKGDNLDIVATSLFTGDLKDVQD